MVACPKCSLTFEDLDLFSIHLQNEHKLNFNVRTNPFVLTFKNSGGYYSEFQRKIDKDERTAMKTFEDISERLKVELPRVLHNLYLPSYLSVKLDLTMTEMDSKTSVHRFYKIRLLGKGTYVSRILPFGIVVEEILQDLDFKFKNGTNFSPGSSFWGFNGILLTIKSKLRNHDFNLEDRVRITIPQYDEKASEKERRKGWMYLYQDDPRGGESSKKRKMSDFEK
jgi:hypothetical protein